MISDEELSLLLKEETWEPLGEGTFNRVNVSKQSITIGSLNSKWVHKLPIPPEEDDSEDDSEGPLNKPERALRKWKQMNPDLPAYSLGIGWITPFLGKEVASDTEIEVKMIEIYRTTRNIIADAPGKGNFRKTSNGEVVCVDVDHAFRVGSPASDDYYKDNETLSSHGDFYRSWQFRYPLTIQLIRTLRYLELHLSQEQIKNDYIRQEVLSKLSVFQQYSEPVTEQTMAMLLTIATIDPDNEIPNIFLDRTLIDELI